MAVTRLVNVEYTCNASDAAISKFREADVEAL